MRNEIIENVVSSAKSAREHSYSPYSDFAVGAAVLCDDGTTIFSGTNVENASFGSTICAERAAIFSAVSAGYRHFIALAVAADGLAYPCGACLQVLAEFADDSAEIIIVDTSLGKSIRTKLGVLLPKAFRLKKRI